MSDTQLEQRIQALEQQMRDVLLSIQSSSSRGTVTKDWRKSLGMFDERPFMKQVDEAGQLIRQQDREQGAA